MALITEGNHRRVEIAPGTFEEGVLYAVTATARNDEKENTARVELEVGNSDVEAVIAGGDRSVALSGIEELSAELSTDPDGEALTFEWTWTHVDWSLDCSDLAESTSAVLFVDRDLLGFRSFQFTVTVTNEASSATASVVLTHLIEPPSVFIEGPSTRFAVANERLVLKGRVESELEATAT